MVSQSWGVIYFGSIVTRVVGEPDAVVTLAAFDCAQLHVVLHGLLAKHLGSDTRIFLSLTIEVNSCPDLSTDISPLDATDIYLFSLQRHIWTHHSNEAGGS